MKLTAPEGRKEGLLNYWKWWFNAATDRRNCDSPQTRKRISWRCCDV